MNNIRTKYLFLFSISFLLESCSPRPPQGSIAATLPDKKDDSEISFDIKKRNDYELISRSMILNEKAGLVVNVAYQKMIYVRMGKIIKVWSISTASRGVGSLVGSGKTPLGKHRIQKKIGDNVPIGGVFRARVYKGEIAKIYTNKVDVKEDLVTTRILHLDGLEPGVNKGAGVDSFERCIYIHGTPEEGFIGTPKSHGCIRMFNDDVIELYDMVEPGIVVEIIRS